MVQFLHLEIRVTHTGHTVLVHGTQRGQRGLGHRHSPGPGKVSQTRSPDTQASDLGRTGPAEAQETVLVRNSCSFFLFLISSVQFRRSVVSDSLRPHRLQRARLPCPSPAPRVYSNSCPLSQWCHPTISSSAAPFSSCLQSFPASGSFPESVLHIRWPKYWNFSFSISPSNEYSGLISFRMDWLDFLAVQGRDTQESSPTPQFKSINYLGLSFLYGPNLTSIH